MQKATRITIGLLASLAAVSAGAWIVNSNIAATTEPETLTQASQFQGGKFHNLVPFEKPGLRKTLAIASRYFTEQARDKAPSQAVPLQTVSREQLQALPDNALHFVKLGHSTVLLKVYGEYWLLDPVFSERASPFSFLGPRRFHPAPISIEQLPAIDKVLISHNHYDHLDRASIKQLAAKTRQFLVPMGVEADLEKWGVAPQQILRFDWWQETITDNATIAFTPTQHFSGRGIGDGNTSLWGSWVIKTAAASVYFSGDSGYFDGFKQIGAKYGPFDLAFIETGAYDKDWPHVHMTPEQSVQAHLDLKADVMVPVHNGTFDLAFHAWYEPLERVSAAAQQQDVALLTPMFGQTVSLQTLPLQLANNALWWRSVMPAGVGIARTCATTTALGDC